MKRSEQAPPATKKPGSLALKRVATGLFRSETSGRYYFMVRHQGKLIRLSLKTKDRKLADRLVAAKKKKVGHLKPGSSQLTFGQVTEQFRQTNLATKDLKPRAREYREYCIESLYREWHGLKTLLVRDVTRTGCEEWFASRRKKISAQLLNNELGTLKMILEFAVREGVIMDNPATEIARVRIPRVNIVIPSHEQFASLTQRLRGNGYHRAADFVELLGYSGMRRNEAASLTWEDVDFQRGQFRVTGGEQGTKNREVRHVPLFPALRTLLERLRDKQKKPPPPTKSIMSIAQCRDSIGAACREAGLPHFTHHSLRHFFCSNAIENGVDFKTIAGWLGHKDGGILVAKTYGHLRQEHSDAMAAKMTFIAPPAEDSQA